jgi:hypothetical protein
VKFVQILFLREFRQLIVSKIAPFPEAAIAIGVEVPTFFGFECWLV